MRVVVTGGAGLVGRAIVRLLRDRGDTVVALVRDPAKAAHLEALGAELVRDDLSDILRLTGTLQGADGAIHAAGSYRVGIPKSEQPAMREANVGTTTRMLEAAEAAAVPRLVYVSTLNVYGNTRGVHVDEMYRRDLRDGFLSWYDETKYEAHEVAMTMIEAGAPVVIAMPSQVYGPGDRTGFGEQLQLAYEGRLPYRALSGVRIGLVHADDLAAGIVARPRPRPSRRGVQPPGAGHDPWRGGGAGGQGRWQARSPAHPAGRTPPGDGTARSLGRPTEPA